MRRMSSSVAMSPAMTAAGSPGVRYSSENTTNATTAMTTKVENSRRTTYAIIRASAPRAAGNSLSLLDVPHERDRSDDDAAQVRAIGGRQDELCRGDVRNELESAGLHRIRRLLRTGGIGGGKPRVAQLLDLRIFRPAEPALLPRAAHREVDRRVREVGT